MGGFVLSGQTLVLMAAGVAVLAVGDRIAAALIGWAKRTFGFNDAVIPPPGNRFGPGEEGEAITPLRPLGHGRFHGRRVAVRAPSQYIERGARIRIIRPEVDWYLVERVRREREDA